MYVRHLFPNTSCVQDVTHPVACFGRNQVGDMVSFYPTRESRYEGWFVQGSTGFRKILERLNVLNADGSDAEVVGLTNTGLTSFFEYGNGIKVGWKLVSNVSGLTIGASKATRLQIVLDVREMYQYPEFDRTYTQTVDSSGLLVEYCQGDLHQFIHIRSRSSFTLLEQWSAQEYPRDAQRHSSPTTLYTYTVAETTTDLLSLGTGLTADAAKAASLAANKQRLQAPRIGQSYTPDTLLTQVNTAKATVHQALRWLESEDGIWAGLPWFHQVWSRDELICALGLTHEEQREIIERYIGHTIREGELPTFIDSSSTCADGVGWLCLLIREYGIHNLSEETRVRTRHFLERAVVGLKQKRQSHHGLIWSGPNATWMDTIGREGFRLEIQCMYALLLELLSSLSQDSTYHQEQIGFLGKVRQHYFKNGYLWDGLNDATIRPNVFLAYLLQPQLLSENSWQQCFDTVLSATVCTWGGISSLDRKDPRFQATSTGENNHSYHNGDSWFFINNVAATALCRFNQRRYSKTIIAVLQSSTDEILWHNMVGQPGEISSASELQSFGCGIQAFSAGTYLALLQELEGYSAVQGRDAMASFWEATTDSTLASFSL